MGTVTTATELLRRIDPPSAAERDRLVAETALAERGTPELGHLLDELGADGGFGARLALRMAIVAGARERVLDLMEAPDPGLGAAAWTAALR